MDYEKHVGIAEIKVGHNPSILTSRGLGSCVAVVLYDPITKIGGMAHILLPNSGISEKVGNSCKFADRAVELLLKKLLNLGAKKDNIEAKIAGGAQVFKIPSKKAFFKIGEQNIAEVRRQLRRLGIKLVAEDVGGNHGRSVHFHLNDGSLHIKTVWNEKII